MQKAKKKHDFEKNSMILFILMMSTNVCNYLFQIIVGNLLAVDDYGIVNTVLSLVGVLSIPNTIVTLIAARYIALNSMKEEENRLPSILNTLIKFAGIVSVVLIIIVLCSLNSIAKLFDIGNRGYIIGALLVSITNLFLAVTAGTLQGMKKFFPYGVQTIFVAAGKLILSVVLILLGWRIYGVIVAVAAGTVIAIVYGIAHMGTFVKAALSYKGCCTVDIPEFCKYAVAAIVAQGCVIAITNGDVLLVKAYFSDTETGIYSSAAVIGKIAMYISTAIIATLFPMVVEKYQKGEDTIPLFKKALLYGGGMSAVCGLGMSVLGKYVIGILFGERYMAAIEILPYVCIFVIPLTFISILMNYVLAIGKAKTFGISIGMGLIIIIGGSMVMHDSVSELMVLCGSVLLCVFVFNICYLMLCKKKNIAGE